MVNDFVAIPSLESSIRLFGGHMRTVAGGWKFFGQQHQSFELMCIVDGQQTTEMKNRPPKTYGPGEVLIISPGTWHVNENASPTAPMTYITCHFDMENLDLKSRLISYVANTVYRADSFFAQMAAETAHRFIEISEESTLSEEEKRLQLQIVFLSFLYDIVHNAEKFRKAEQSYTDREAVLARSMATMISDDLKSDQPVLSSFEDVCRQLTISTGYGHRVFRKVYGITPLHYLEDKKYGKAKRLLGSPEYTVEQVSRMIGAKSVSAFSKQFKKWSGIAPSKYQQQATQKRSVRTVKGSGYFE
ncbi:MAG TPA: AraC family transcriptional regulator [Levilactobacillus hammesii]|uniref:AraC family transcriptional regulator n=1 Tax=Levilactobacillus hammesii TaxID=267633 RepID=A0A921F0A0_9LACO|nr:AraC family transcriptional regulator [Levilactobacillus hammesii]